MKLEEFNSLSAEEQETFLTSIETTQKSIDDLTAEIDSYKTENAELKAQFENTNKELKATKEMNFTLARKINTEPAKDPDTILHDLIKEFNNGH